jgi:hypothetical protein
LGAHEKVKAPPPNIRKLKRVSRFYPYYKRLNLKNRKPVIALQPERGFSPFRLVPDKPIQQGWASAHPRKDHNSLGLSGGARRNSRLQPIQEKTTTASAYPEAREETAKKKTPPQKNSIIYNPRPVTEAKSP